MGNFSFYFSIINQLSNSYLLTHLLYDDISIYVHIYIENFLFFLFISSNQSWSA